MVSSFHPPPSAGKVSDVTRRVAHWLMMGRAFLTLAGFYRNVPKRIEPWARRVAAFLLHQGAEMFLNGILAPVPTQERRRMRARRAEATGSRGRAHDLGELMHYAESICPGVRLALPRGAGEDLRLFTLLSSAYTRSRYSEARFDPSPGDVATLIKRVRALGKVATVSSSEAPLDRGEE